MLSTEYAKQNLKPLYKSDACNWWLCNPQFDTGEEIFCQSKLRWFRLSESVRVAPMMNTRRNTVSPDGNVGDLAEYMKVIDSE